MVFYLEFPQFFRPPNNFMFICKFDLNTNCCCHFVYVCLKRKCFKGNFQIMFMICWLKYIHYKINQLNLLKVINKHPLIDEYTYVCSYDKLHT